MVYHPHNFKLEESTIWSFPDRGQWATHSGVYRGNWSPYIPRNIILRYTKEKDYILDQFLGSGTTLIEAKLLNRNAIGVDINEKALNLARINLNFSYEHDPTIILKQGDAKNLSFIKTDYIDLVCTHPPYADIIQYSKDLAEDISRQPYDKFLSSMENVARESFRVLKENGICAFMMGDIRKKGNILPLGMQSMQKFIDAGFILKEIIIKEQHNCRSTDYWKSRSKTFLMIAHEYIFIFEKKHK